MADFEKIEIDPVTSEVRFEVSDFGQVVFHNIQETYSTEADVECCYTITSNLVPSRKDWIGIYRVGWKSSNDYIYSHYSPLPTEAQTECKLDFEARYLPKEDGEFYQFCYVTSSNQVRGASTPFQFKQPCGDDFLEVEDEEDGMMVIKNKTITLQEQINDAVKEKEGLLQKLGLLQEERDSLLDKLVDYNKMLHGEKIEREQLQKQLNTKCEKIASMDTEIKDMALLNDGLREKITFLEQEKDSILKRLDENERYISSMQEKIKALINEKDALTGKNKSLEQEKELFKNHFTSSEGTIAGYMREIERLKHEVKTQEDAAAQHAANACKFKTELKDINRKFEKQMALSKTDKDHLEGLSEKLRNSEDKLNAAEHCKTLLNDEVTAVQQAHQKMSQDLEKSKMECDTWRQRLSALEIKSSESEKLWNQEKVYMQKQLNQKETDIAQELNCIREQLQLSEERHQSDKDKDGSLYALQMAQDHLKERYSRMKKENAELSKAVGEYSLKQKRWESTERDLHKEIEDLKERLSMGAEEYKLRYLENRKLQTEVKKLQKQLKRSNSTVSTETEQVRRSSVGSGTERVQHNTVAMETERVRNTSVGSETEKIARSSVALETDKVMNNHVAIGTERVDNASVASETDQVHNNHVSTGTEHVVRSSVASETERIATTETDTNTPDEEKWAVCSQTEQTGSIADLTNSELQMQLDDLGRELEQRYSKKQKYKQMYTDEREKNALLQKHYHEELYNKDLLIKDKNQQIQKLLKIIRDLDVNQGDEQSDSADPLQAEEEPPRALEAPLTPLPAPMIPEVLPSAKIAAVMSVVKPSSCNDDEDLMKRSCTVITSQPRAAAIPPPPTGAGAAASGPTAPEMEETEDDRDFSLDAPEILELSHLSRHELPSRFMDADGEPQINEPEFHDAAGDLRVVEPQFHDAEGEPQKLCPVCNTMFPADLPQHMFEEHVDSHYGPVCPLCSEHFGAEADQRKFESHVQAHFDQE